MNRRPSQARTDQPAGGPPRTTTTQRILIVCASAERARTLTRAAIHDDAVCTIAESIPAASGMLGRPSASSGNAPAQRRFEGVVLDVARCTPAALRFVRELDELRIRTVIVCPEVSFDEAVEAMRAGAADVLTGGLKNEELSSRIRSALSGPGGVLRAPDEQEPIVQPPACLPEPERVEFDRLISGELDVETLLRTALEFILARCGSTNAAVFLPSTGGDFSLGAYVNYSCPKDTAEVLLDHLANVAAPRLESLEGLVTMNTPASIERHLGDCCHWINDCQVLAFACRHEGETLALFMLFRDAARPFNDEAVRTLAMVRERFAEQLARVVRIHHRHLPRDRWGALGDPSDGGDDMAA